MKKNKKSNTTHSNTNEYNVVSTSVLTCMFSTEGESDTVMLL